ncbi:MAG TPA: hypothetical protein VHM72_08325 [Solirubrobacteraceae bacterium]|nr:hypothetical protein [Solirubrobacteraceae bacterium]
MSTQPGNRDAGAWAQPVHRLTVSEGHINVSGRRPTAPMHGFGRMWQKTYRTSLAGTDVSPSEAITVWKQHFPEFWPAGNRFFAPLAGIAPGEVAALDLSMPGGLKLSTGVLVLYADDESFTLMTPEGHMFAGWITFSAFVEDGATCAQAQVLMRASDPLYELGMTFGGHRQEDAHWSHTLTALALHLGASGEVSAETVCVDRKRQWSRAGNVWHNAGMRSALHMAGAPGRMLKNAFRRHEV